MHKLDSIEHKLEEIRDCLQSHKKDIEEIKRENQIIYDTVKKIRGDTMNTERNISIIQIAVLFFSVAFGMGVYTLIMSFFPVTLQQFIEFITSWATIFFIIFYGIFSSVLLRKNRRLFTLNCFAFSSILVCYLAYAIIDFGSIKPHISAVMFNFATVMQCFSAFCIVRHFNR